MAMANPLTDEEINWMITKRPLVLDVSQLTTDYGAESQEMMKAFEDNGLTAYAGCLNWPGVGTRWKEFVSFLKALPVKPADAKQAFVAFGNHLGRVASFRALALTDQQYKTILAADAIWPSGRLKVDSKTLEKTIDQAGVKKVAYARLYIGLRILPYDPSLSLHDDGETAVCIASGYMEPPLKRVHLMQLVVPKIEVMGYTVLDVQDSKHRWFKHRGIWFDAALERTERYCLYEIPFLSKRLMSLKIFDNEGEVNQYLAGFKAAQLAAVAKTEPQLLSNTADDDEDD